MSEDFFIRYPLISKILEQMMETIFGPPQFRPEGMLLVADANNGKSWTFRKLAAEVRAKVQSSDGESCRPIITIQAPVAAVRRDLFTSLARALCIPEAPKMSALKVRQRTIDALADARTLAVCVDELHHIMPGGWTRQRVILDDLKYISNELRIPVFLAGTDQAHLVVARDEQYLDRFPPLRLPRWNLDRDFLWLLRAVEHHMKVPEGSFTQKAHAELIWKHSRGLLGRVLKICDKAHRKARFSPSGQITEAEINAAGFGDLPWIAPASAGVV